MRDSEPANASMTKGGTGVADAEARNGKSTRVGMHTVAREAGVSVATVSNVINRPEIVSQGLRAKVEKSIDDLGYIVNAAARSLRTGKTESLGAVVFDLANPFFAVAARHMANVASDRGYSLTVMSTDQVSRREEESFDFLLRHGVRGVAVTTAMQDLSGLEAIHDLGVSITLLAQASDHPEIGSVHIDDDLGMRLIVEHLLATGRRNLGFIDGPGRARQHVARRSAILRVLDDAGMDASRCLTEIVAPAPDLRGGRAATLELLERANQGVDAIICVNDYTAIGVILALQSMGLRVPEDIAVTGFDDIEMSEILAVPLTTIRQPIAEMGRMAIEQLVASVEAGGKAKNRVLTPELVIRESTTSSS